MRKLTTAAATVALTLAAGSAQPYSVSTHEVLSLQATLRSVIHRESSLFADLGQPAPSSLVFVGSDGVLRTANSLVAYGAIEEDAGVRFLNHFFDPQYLSFVGRGLTAPAGEASPDWALEDRGDFPRNSFRFGTRWTVTMGCSGKTLSNSNRIEDRIGVYPFPNANTGIISIQ